MQFFWEDDIYGYSLYTTPKAKLMSIMENEGKWSCQCLGSKKEFGAVSQDIAKKLAELWLVDTLCDIIIELRKRNESVS